MGSETTPKKGRRKPTFLLVEEERAKLSEEIEMAGGAEVLSAATVTDDGKWASLRVLARGTDEQAPAVLRGLRPGDVLLHNHPNGILEPSDADLGVASLCGQSGIGFAIHDNACRHAYVVVEPFKPERLEKIDPAPLARYLDRSGGVGRLLPNREERPGQVHLLEAVVKAFNHPCHAILEGETGIGKSMAYLLPAVHFAKANRCRVAISTNTINLQHQLCSKDLPLLQKALPLTFTFCLVKGRGNYLCKRRLEEAERSVDGDFLLEKHEVEQFERLLAWAEKTRDGSLSDLNWVPTDSLWEKINADKDACLGVRCTEYSRCFFYDARRRAAEADLLVVNHHLLCADLALRAATKDYSQTAVIPAYKAAILDEAHNLEETVTKHFGYRVTGMGVQRILGRLYQRRGRRERGVLAVLAGRISDGQGDFTDRERDSFLEEIREQVAPARDEVGERSQTLFESITGFLLEGRIGRHGEFKQRLTPAFEQTEAFATLAKLAKELDTEMQRLAKMVRRLLNRLTSRLTEMDDPPRTLEMPVVELGGVARRLDEVRAGLVLPFDLETPERAKFVHFLSVKADRQSRWPAFQSSPIVVADALVEHAYTRIPSLVLVSGTLTTQQTFTFIKHRLGLDSDTLDPAPIEGRFPSPFDYATQAQLFLPNDLPLPSAPDFIGQTIEPVFQIARSSAGGTLVLCTSYTHLRELSEQLGPRLEQEGLEALTQGEMEKHHLLERFKEDGNAVLFATDSFWEGVDVPGSALRNLVITKLPFLIPDDPILEARQEVLQQEGRHPFFEYQLPMAILKLKQGFGRLIRSRSDRGTVWILDKRLVTKPYGQQFLDSLPPARASTGPWKKLLEQAEQFFHVAEQRIPVRPRLRANPFGPPET